MIKKTTVCKLVMKQNKLNAYLIFPFLSSNFNLKHPPCDWQQSWESAHSGDSFRVNLTWFCKPLTWINTPSVWADLITNIASNPPPYTSECTRSCFSKSHSLQENQTSPTALYGFPRWHFNFSPSCLQKCMQTCTDPASHDVISFLFPAICTYVCFHEGTLHHAQLNAVIHRAWKHKWTYTFFSL